MTVLSVWMLIAFCNTYLESTAYVPDNLGQLTLPPEPPTPQPAEPICRDWLWLVVTVAAGGIACSLGGRALERNSRSSTLSETLASVGRLIALGSLGTVLLVVLLYKFF